MKWIKLKDKKPNKIFDGSKILIYRIMNENQRELSMTIYDTSMIKYCDENETWWMPLPAPPITY